MNIIENIVARRGLIAFLGLLGLILVACGAAEPDIPRADIVADEQAAYRVDFEQADAFEVDDFGPAGQLEIAEGRYLVQTSNPGGAGYLWGSSLDSPQWKNVRVEVEAASLEGPHNNWYGVVCRLDEDGGGYALLVSADGFWGIARTDGMSLFFIENWRENDAIRAGHNAANHLEAYCLDDYLALYVNDTFLGEVRDDRIDQAGGVGLLAGGPGEELVRVAFDNLTLTSVHRNGRPNTPAPATDVPTPTVTVEPLDVPPLDVPPLDENGGLDGNDANRPPTPTPEG